MKWNGKEKKIRMCMQHTKEWTSQHSINRNNFNLDVSMVGMKKKGEKEERIKR